MTRYVGNSIGWRLWKYFGAMAGLIIKDAELGLACKKKLIKTARTTTYKCKLSNDSLWRKAQRVVEKERC